MMRRSAWLFSYIAVAVSLMMIQQSRAQTFAGVVWYDNDGNGIRGGGEPGVSGIIVEVYRCSDGAFVNSVAADPNGSWTFSDGTFPQFPTVPLGGTYFVRFTHLPPGYGITTQIYPPPADGTVVSTANPLTGCTPCFTFTNYVDFALNNAGIYQGARPPINPLVEGDAAGIGFWHNKHGQALIKALNGGPNSKVLATWLATNFPCLYGANAKGNNLTGKNNNAVASLFVQCGRDHRNNADAQILATALSVYVTDYDLAGTVAERYGFNVSSSGTGDKTYNVGRKGPAIGLLKNNFYSVSELLQQANLMKQNGTFDTKAFNHVFGEINSEDDDD